MPRITLKETITKELDITMEVLYDLIDKLSQEEREKVLDRLTKKPVKLKTFKKDKIESILSDLASTDLYEEDFLRDLEDGLKKSSVYNK